MNNEEADRMAAEIHEQSRNDETIRAIVEWINSDLGESPEAIRGAMTAFMMIGAVVMTGVSTNKDPTVATINLIAAWQCQPHVMHMINELAARREH